MQSSNNNAGNGAANQTSEQVILTLKIIWGALLGSIFIYVFVAFTKTQTTSLNFDLADATPKNQFEYLLSGMAILMVILSFVISNFFLTSLRKQVTTQTDLRTLLNFYFTPFIIKLALLESCTIFGLVMAFIRGSAAIMLPFALLTFIGFLLSIPSEATIRAALQGPDGGPERI